MENESSFKASFKGSLCPRLPHARGVGAARFHLAGVATFPWRLAGKVRTDSVGLRRDHPQSGSARARRFDCQQRTRGGKCESGPGEGGRALGQHCIPDPIPLVYAEIIRNLARHERVDLIVNSERAEGNARAVLERADALSDNIVFHRWRTDRVWTRDSGCIFLVDSMPADPRLAPRERARTWGTIPDSTTDKSDSPLLALQFQFNAWAKYDNYKLDAKLGARMAKAAGARVVQPITGDHLTQDQRVVLEGGSIDVNGLGTLITTEECLLSTAQQRNPHMDRKSTRLNS